MLAQLLASDPSGLLSLLWFSLAWLAATVFWLWVLLDCLTVGRVIGREKTAWVIVLLCTYVVGAILYLLLVRFKRPATPD